MASYVFKLFYLAIIVGLVCAGDDEEPQVSINVLYKPDFCRNQAKPGDYITLTYVGFVPSEAGNDQFDSSDSLGPVHFRLNDPESTAMKGWHQGMTSICKDEKRELLIPFGELTANHKLPNTKPPPNGGDIGYTVHVRNIQGHPPSSNLFKKMDFDEDQQITREELRAFLSKEALHGLKEGETLDQAVQNIFTNADHDKSGTLTEVELFGRKHDEL